MLSCLLPVLPGHRRSGCVSGSPLLGSEAGVCLFWDRDSFGPRRLYVRSSCCAGAWLNSSGKSSFDLDYFSCRVPLVRLLVLGGSCHKLCGLSVGVSAFATFAFIESDFVHRFPGLTLVALSVVIVCHSTLRRICCFYTFWCQPCGGWLIPRACVVCMAHTCMFAG